MKKSNDYMPKTKAEFEAYIRAMDEANDAEVKNAKKKPAKKKTTAKKK